MAGLTSSLDYQTRVLQGLFCVRNSAEDKRQRVRQFVYSLNEDNFTGKNRVCFQLIARYYYLTNDLISPNDFMDAIRAIPDSTEVQVQEFKDLLVWFLFGEVIVKDQSRPDGSKAYLTQSEFTYIIDRLVEQSQLDRYGTLLAETMEILVNGKTVSGKSSRGLDAARRFYATELSTVDRLGHKLLPEGNVQDEIEELRKEYAQLKHGELAMYRVLSGIRDIDEATSGFGPGDLIFIAGYTGEFKTTQCINVSYHAMLCGQNVVYGTSETLRHLVRRRLISRHSLHPKFGNMQGLPLDLLKTGKLSDEQERLYLNVLEDLESEQSYGRFKIVQLPARCTPEYFGGLLMKYESEFYIHLAVWDELRLGGYVRKRDNRREEMNDLIIESKSLVTTHRHLDGTIGTVLLLPYQVARDKWQEAIKAGFYTKACMAETSESEKTADLLWAMLMIPEQQTTIKNFILKNRDGAATAVFDTDIRANVACITSRERISHEDLLQ